MSLGLCLPYEAMVYQFSEYIILLHEIQYFYFVIPPNSPISDNS